MPEIFCANCGGIGHIYKKCNHPVTSFGVICFKIVYDEVNDKCTPHFLMVQRKDSLNFVEFIRGKYNINHRTYLLKLFSGMTDFERSQIRSESFDTLWKNMWMNENLKSFVREYNDAKGKFETLRNGFILINEHNASHEELFFNLEYIIDNSTSTVSEAEWGFPKGRRNINENDYICAFREFKEETGIHHKNIRVLNNFKPFEEIFSGSNDIRYKHIYYVATCCNDVKLGISGKQGKEIKAVQWFTYQDAQDKISVQNIERKELFKRVNTKIEKLME
jgi:8-oxo-dGTP pyrophosphatase MutT (NUDIX family)